MTSGQMAAAGVRTLTAAASRFRMVQIEKSEKMAILAVALNAALFGLKFLASILSGSLALKAESFHSLADLIAATTVLFGLKIARRKSREFPYGLYKFENVMAIFIAMAILYTGYEIVMDVFRGPAPEIRHSGPAIAILAFSALLSFAFTRYEKRMAKLIGSPVLQADAEHRQGDVLSNLAVFGSLLSGLLGFNLDRIAAVAVVLVITWTGLQILKDGFRVLLDASIDRDTMDRVEKIIRNVPQVVALKSLTGRNSGRYKFIEAEIVLKTHDFEKAHLLVRQIEAAVRDEIKDINRILIQYEPLKKAVTIYALPLADKLSEISDHFGEAPHFLLATVNNESKDVVRIQILDNPFKEAEKGKGILMAEQLVHVEADVVVLKSGFTNKGPYYVLAEAKIEIIQSDKRSPQAALEALGVTVPDNMLRLIPA